MGRNRRELLHCLSLALAAQDTFIGRDRNPTDRSRHPTGEREMRRHERASAEYLAGRNALRLVGLEAERVVDSVCARDCALAGFGELNALRAGLQALAALWAAKRKARAR